MSDTQDNITNQRETLAAAFNKDTDPLAEHASTFEQMDNQQVGEEGRSFTMAFEIFISEVLKTDNLAEDTLRSYRTVFTHWCEYMEREGRHPACPAERHVKAFVRHLADRRDNHPRTIKQKLWRLSRAYAYWQDDPAFPHPQDFDPFSLARSKIDLSAPAVKDPPRIPLDELRDIMADVTHIQKRAVIAIQLKLGLRAGEVCNIQLQDVNLQNAELQQFYPELGSHPKIDDKSSAIFIPSRQARDGNKSRRPRVLPLDDELRHMLIRYLLIRPQTDVPWVFLSDSDITSTTRQKVNEHWTDAFQPAYAETDDRRAVTSHFGRHYFSTYWKIQEDLNRELVKYMRGDVVGNAELTDRDVIDEYLHTYYEDIEPVYRERIFKLNV